MTTKTNRLIQTTSFIAIKEKNLVVDKTFIAMQLLKMKTLLLHMDCIRHNVKLTENSNKTQVKETQGPS